jgi:DNA-binding NarL/FixJ family response regulator
MHTAGIFDGKETPADSKIKAFNFRNRKDRQTEMTAMDPQSNMSKLKTRRLPRGGGVDKEVEGGKALSQEKHMNRIILADNQVIFRAGAARILALEEDIRLVAQCEDLAKLWSALENLRGTVLLVASSLQPDVPALIERAKMMGSRVILIAENTEQVPDPLVSLLDGVICRNISGTDLVDAIRRIARGQRYMQRANVTAIHSTDSVGARVRDRLTPKEMQIVSLIVQGCKNKEIAQQLGTKEQVIKNYLRGIYDKTGVSDRLELALFTIHHRVLADAAARAGNLIEMKSA